VVVGGEVVEGADVLLGGGGREVEVAFEVVVAGPLADPDPHELRRTPSKGRVVAVRLRRPRLPFRVLIEDAASFSRDE
jgi:hypothetical protein